MIAEPTLQQRIMRTRFDCSSAMGIEPSDLLDTVIKEVQWTEGSEVLELMLTRKVCGRVTAVNDCNLESISGLSAPAVLQALTRLSSLEIMHRSTVAGPEKKDSNIAQSTDERSGITNTDTNSPQTTRLLFLQVPDGAMGLDLRAAHSPPSASASASWSCGGLLVTAVLASSSEFRPGDVITACSGVALSSMDVQAAIAELVQGSSREMVVIRRSISFSGSSSGSNSSSSGSSAGIHEEQCCARPRHWLPSPHPPPYREQRLRSSCSPYTLYVRSSRHRAASRASFDYIPGLD